MKASEILFCVGMMVFSAPVPAQYKCVLAGKTHYQDRPCDGDPHQAPMALQVPSGLGDTRSTSATTFKAEAARQSRVNEAIMRNRPAVGMREAELAAALGSPTRRNLGTYGTSESNQLIYERGDRTWYVYTDEKGNVRSFQNSATMGAGLRTRRTTKDALVQY